MAINTMALNKMQKGRSLLVYERPAWAPLAFKLELIETDKLETMATDGRKLYYFPQFVLDRKMAHLIFIQTHELMHCAFRHPARRGNRHPQIFNIACDIAINNILVYEEAMEAPEDALLDKKYMGWSCEDIYDDLMKAVEEALKKYPNPTPSFVMPGKGEGQDGGQVQKSDQQGQQKSKGKGAGKSDKKDGEKQDGSGSGQQDKQDKQDGSGDQQDGKDGDSGDSDNPFGGKNPWDKELEDDWKSAVVAAQQMAKMRGTGSSWLDREVQQVVEPRFKLETILNRIIGTGIGEDSSWKSPNRRFVSRGIHLPSIVKDRKEGIVVLDVSGSVDDESVQKFIGMTLRLAKSKGIQKLRIIQCDYAVTDDQTITKPSQYKKKRSAQGGTSFKPPFELIAKDRNAKWNTSFLIYLTDLDGDFPEVAPKFPVFWVSIKEQAAPFGTSYYWDEKSDRVKHIRGRK